MCCTARRLSLQRYHPGVLASCSFSSTIDSLESPSTFWLPTGFEHFIFLLFGLLIFVGRNSNMYSINNIRQELSNRQWPVHHNHLCMANQLSPKALLYLFQGTVKHHRSPSPLCHFFWWSTRAFDPHQDFWKEWLKTSVNRSAEISLKLHKGAENAYESTLVLLQDSQASRDTLHKIW